MVDAYRGTIDYEGESIVEAREAVAELLADEDTRLEWSSVLEQNGEIVAAILLGMFEGSPFIHFVMTGSGSTGQGLAAALLTVALEDLSRTNEKTVTAMITSGNVASERLFVAAGFEVDPEG